MSSYDRILLGTKRFPNNRAPKPSAPEDHWLLAYIKKNPFQSGIAMATLYGVLVIFAYHFHIEYFPSFDLKSLASTIFAAAYTALLFLAVFSLGLFAPAYAIGSWGLDEPAGGNAEEKVSLQRRIMKSFGLAYVIFLAACLVFLAVIGLDLWVGFLFLSLPLIASICVLVVERRPANSSATTPPTRSANAADQAPETPAEDPKITLDKDEPQPGWRKRAGAAVATFWSFIWSPLKRHAPFIGTMCFVAFMEVFSIMILFYMLYDSPELKASATTWDVLLTLVGKLMWSGFFLHAIGAYLVSAWRNPEMKPAHRGFSFAAALAAPVLVSGVIGKPVLFFALTAMTTKYGNFRAAEMTLTNTGCRIVESGGDRLCVRQSDGTNKVCNVYVMSRIGTETYLLVSSPGRKKAALDAAKAAKASPPGPAKWVLNVYVPSKEILGSWMDTPERHFDKDNIVAALGKTPSVCDAVAPSAAPAPPATPPTAPVPPVPPAAPVPPKDDGSNVERLAPVRTMFGFDKYDLTQDGMAALRTYADGLVAKKAASMSIRVVGHADSIGQPYHNLRLSQMRAITVRNYLQTYLQNSSNAATNLNIDFNGAGTTQPLLADEKCPGKGANEKRVACLQPNRRAEVVATWAESK